MMELLVGVVFAAIVLALPYLHDKVGKGGGMKFPKISFLRKKEVEEKLQEVDKQLEEVVAAGVSKKEDRPEEGKAEEKVVPLDDAAKTVQIDDNLLEEMETGNVLKAEEGAGEEDAQLPDIPELPELNADLDVDVEDIEGEIKLDSDAEEEEEEEEDIEEVEFDEEDDLISSIAKEVEVKEEEEIDLLRELKGQKITAEELEKELQETLQRLKAIAGVE